MIHSQKSNLSASFFVFFFLSLSVHALIFLYSNHKKNRNPFQISASYGVAVLLSGESGEAGSPAKDLSTGDSSNSGSPGMRAGILTDSISSLLRTIEYPALAREMEMQGLVLIECDILDDGHTANVRIKKSSGFEILDESAKNSILRWTFPTGESQRIEIPVRFKLVD